jgi:chromatin remodeling complex protein RSC6
MAKKSARKPNAAFMKPVQPNEKLAAVVGSNPLPRTELTKKLWAYIKKNGLQDKKVRTQINADDKLKAVFGGKAKHSMCEITNLVSNNLEYTFLRFSLPPPSPRRLFCAQIAGNAAHWIELTGSARGPAQLK